MQDGVGECEQRQRLVPGQGAVKREAEEEQEDGVHVHRRPEDEHDDERRRRPCIPQSTVMSAVVSAEVARWDTAHGTPQ